MKKMEELTTQMTLTEALDYIYDFRSRFNGIETKQGYKVSCIIYVYDDNAIMFTVGLRSKDDFYKSLESLHLSASSYNTVVDRLTLLEQKLGEII